MGERTGGRLKEAIGRKYGSVRKFQRVISKAESELVGTSRTTIDRYLSGERAPSPGFVAAAARLLGVRRGWLAGDEGAPTDREERLRLHEPAWEVGELERAAMASLLEATPDFVKEHLTFEYRHLSAVVIKIAERILDDDREASYRRAGRLVGECIAAPLGVLGVQHVPFGIDNSRTMQAYVTAAAHAVEIMSAHVRQDAFGGIVGEDGQRIATVASLREARKKAPIRTTAPPKKAKGENDGS